ncbi:GTP pyrophosphokinase [Tsuneonella mangrovi]|uniref:GTP pyrophosphokinase n=1 Tax=Tsuneonella mangrovi TaxID=1982042 RepID=UPI000BA1CC0F|nr:RelA/SpoT domain-containing protein [Tsuneonella mangrovi]
MTLSEEYADRFASVLTPSASLIQKDLVEWLDGEPRIDRISARAKSVDRFVAKASKMSSGKPKYDDPLNEIQDQIGARIIVFYEYDVDRVSDIINRYLKPIEFKMMSPESQWTFGYFGKHFIYLTPTHIVESAGEKREEVPFCFELQIKTLFQHAWSEANHDLGYKPGEQELDPEHERMLAFASAQAWGADKTFSQLVKERAG